jgi:hypothetical protein
LEERHPTFTPRDPSLPPTQAFLSYLVEIFPITTTPIIIIIIIMKALLYHALLMLAVTITSCDAVHKPKPHETFRIVLDNHSPRGPSIGFRSNTSMDFDAKAFAKKLQSEAMEVVDRVWEETRKVTEKFQSEAKDLISQLRHYNKVEIGLYTALAVSLTIALKSKKHILEQAVIAFSPLPPLSLTNHLLPSPPSSPSVCLFQGYIQDRGLGGH